MRNVPLPLLLLCVTLSACAKAEADSGELTLGSSADELLIEDEPEAPEPTPTPQFDLGALTQARPAASAPATKAAAPAPKAPAPAPKADPGLGIEGGRTLSPAQVKSVIDRHAGQVRACYERELKTHSGLAGKVTVAFTIGADGRPRSPRIATNSTGNRAMQPCITRAVSRWRFPRAESAFDVEYPFVFRPTEF